MQISNIPPRLKSAFSIVGNKAEIPQAAVDDARASYSLGFPPKNMTPVASGGVPPDGRDMNGILFEISNAALWAQAMGVMPFEAAFAAAVGYPQGAMVQHGGSVWRSTVDGNSVTPSAVSANWERMSLEGGTAGQALMKISSKTGDYSWRELAIADVTNLQVTLVGKTSAGNAMPLMDGVGTVGTSANAAREDHRHPTDTSRAPLESPALTGTPTAPTATAGTNTSQLATTEFVQGEKPAVATQAEMEAGTETAVRSMSPLRVAQAIAAKATGVAIGIRGQVFTASGTFTVPAGVTAIKVRGCAGGGGGGGGGGAGGTTSFGAYCSATGGSGTAPGTGSGGDINLAGGFGGDTGAVTGQVASGGAVGGGYGGGGVNPPALLVAPTGLLGGSGHSSAAATGYGNGGGCTAPTNTSRTAGSAGGYFERYITGLTPGAAITVTIGQAGAGPNGRAGAPGICIVEW